MSNNLEKKLNAVLNDHDSRNYERAGNKPLTITEIEKAFIDDGWINTKEGGLIKLPWGDYMTCEQWEAKAIKDGWIHVTASQETQAAIANTMLGNKVMTGQAWYDKFKYELMSIPTLWTKNDIPKQLSPYGSKCLEAAKKASGIS